MSKKRKSMQQQTQYAEKTPGTRISRRRFSLGVSGIMLSGAAGEAYQHRMLPSHADPGTFHSMQPGMTPWLSHQPQDVFPGTAGCVWSPDGQKLALFQEQSITLYDARTGQRCLHYQQHTDDILTVKWSADNRYLASSGFDPIVHVWEAATGHTITRYRGHSQIVREVAWSPQHAFLASAGYDKTVQIWEALTGSLRVTYIGHEAEISALTWSPDGRFLTSTDLSNTTLLWRIE